MDKKQKYEKICEKKLSTSVDMLCKGYPGKLCLPLNCCVCLLQRSCSDDILGKTKNKKLVAKITNYFSGVCYVSELLPISPF